MRDGIKKSSDALNLHLIATHNCSQCYLEVIRRCSLQLDFEPYVRWLIVVDLSPVPARTQLSQCRGDGIQTLLPLHPSRKSSSPLSTLASLNPIMVRSGDLFDSRMIGH